MKKGIKYFKILWINCSYGWYNLYSGIGYTQGMGFDFSYKALKIGKIKIIIDIDLNVNNQWLRWLQRNIEFDKQQQLKEIK